MVSLLLIISFLLHIVIFIAYFNLSNQMALLKEENISEIEQLFAKYLDEIKLENDRLQQEILQPNQTNKIASNEKQKKPTNNVVSYTRKDLINQVKNEPVQSTNKLKQEAIKQDDVVETSIEANALQLYEQGYSATEIAQQLNRGTTEISLIIELNQREKIIEN